MKRWLQSIMEEEFEVQTPTRLGSNKKENRIAYFQISKIWNYESNTRSFDL